MSKFFAKIEVVWHDFLGANNSKIINVEVEAEDRETAERLAFAEGQEWLRMTDYPSGLQIRSLTENEPSKD